MPRKRQPRPAFPQVHTTETVTHATDVVPGLTNRELFAGLSLLGIRAAGHEFDARLAASRAVTDADCLIAELAKDGPK